MRTLDLVLPGHPATLTGGYLYDRRILDGLGALGWQTRRLDPGDDFPDASAATVHAANDLLDAVPDGRLVVVDGLALADLAAALEHHAARLRIVALVHHPLCDETGLSPAAAARLCRDELRGWRAARGVIVTSPWTMRRVAGIGYPVRRIRVVEPGTDPSQRAAASSGSAAAETRALPGRDPAAPRPLRLLCVATLTPRKGHAVLLDALARLKDRPWRLDCVGSAARDAATAADLRTRIERLELADRVTLHGEVSADALAAFLQAADGFVLPSYLEGYGMAFADALAHGLPIVATDAGAVADTVCDAALLVPAGDVAALEVALTRLLDDPALRASLADRARTRGAALPSWEDASRRFAAAVDELAAFDPGPAR